MSGDQHDIKRNSILYNSAELQELCKFFLIFHPQSYANASDEKMRIRKKNSKKLSERFKIWKFHFFFLLYWTLNLIRRLLSEDRNLFLFEFSHHFFLYFENSEQNFYFSHLLFSCRRIPNVSEQWMNGLNLKETFLHHFSCSRANSLFPLLLLIEDEWSWWQVWWTREWKGCGFGMGTMRKGNERARKLKASSGGSRKREIWWNENFSNKNKIIFHFFTIFTE